MTLHPAERLRRYAPPATTIHLTTTNITAAMRPNSKKISKTIHAVIAANIGDCVHFPIFKKDHFIPADTANEM